MHAKQSAISAAPKKLALVRPRALSRVRISRLLSVEQP